MNEYWSSDYAAGLRLGHRRQLSARHWVESCNQLSHDRLALPSASHQVVRRGLELGQPVAVVAGLARAELHERGARLLVRLPAVLRGGVEEEQADDLHRGGVLDLQTRQHRVGQEPQRGLELLGVEPVDLDLGGLLLALLQLAQQSLDSGALSCQVRFVRIRHVSPLCTYYQTLPRTRRPRSLLTGCHSNCEPHRFTALLMCCQFFASNLSPLSKYKKISILSGMYLQKLVISGFKSFVDQTTFTFDAPFVAIVGPNGSGKTNVADAMRWVMGEQSLKLMRMKVHTDSIFAGSASRARLGLAQVDLYINNADHRLPLDYDQVIISRRLARDGDTEYLINKNPVRLQDIILLLAQANFGQKSYGVIGQGMITDILNANPQDRKGFFDEATGVKEFQIKRDQSINKLIRTEENLTRVEDVLREIEPHLQSLTRQVKKLEKRQVVEEKLGLAQVQYYGSTLFGYTTKITELDQQLNEAQAAHTVAQGKLNGVQEEIDRIGKEESRTELYHRLQNEYNLIVEKKNNLLKEQAIIQGRLELEHERSGEIDLLWLQRQADDIKQRQQQAKADHTISEEAVAHQQIQLQKLETAQAGVKHELEKLEKELSQANTQLTRLAQALSVPEITQRLDHLFQRQEQFLRELLATNSLDQFKVMQKQAQEITAGLAELLDQLQTERTEDLALQRRLIQSIEQRVRTTAELKEKLLEEHTTLAIAVAAQREKMAFLATTNDRLTTELVALTTQIEERQRNLAEHSSLSKQMETYQAKSQTLINELEKIEQTLALKKTSLDDFNQAEEAKKQRLLELQTQARQIQTELNRAANRVQAVEIELTKLQTKVETLHGEISREVTAAVQTQIEQWNELRHDQDQLLIQIEQLKHQLELIGGIDPEIVQEHTDTKQRFDFLSTQAKDLRKTITSLETVIDELDTTIKRQFDKSFKAINKNFAHYFTVLFGGGEAKLDMQIAADEPTVAKTPTTPAAAGSPVPVEVTTAETEPERESHTLGKLKKKQRIISGIDIIAHPPGKKLSTIHALSGGEKSLVAIALLCAIIGANTPPFVVMDEVEAALDESNSDKVAAIIKHLAEKTQFVVITHNRATMHQADVLYGVTMKSDGTSKILSVKLTEAEKMIEQGKVA